MLGFFRNKRPAPRANRTYRAQLEILEDRTAPATITLAGAGRFQDGLPSGLIYKGGNSYTATNLRSAIIGANNMRGDDTIVLENGTYTLDGTIGQLIVGDPSGALTITGPTGGSATIDARGQTRIFLNQGSLVLSNLILKNGLAADRGGAIFNNGPLLVNNCQFVNNVAQGGLDGGPVQGGAIFNYFNRSLTVQNSTFSGNRAVGGTSSVLYAGTAPASGGAIYISGGLTFVYDTVVGCTFVSNQARGGDGIVFFGYGSPGGYGAGGGVFAEAGNYLLTVANSTFAYNAAQGGRGALAGGGNAAGGAIYVQYGGQGSVSLANDTIALNTATGGTAGGPVTNAPGIGSGGGVATSLYPFVYPLPPLATIINTIVAQNSAAVNADVDGVFRSLGSNLIGDASGATASFNATTGDFTGTKAAPLSPNLDPLGNYGGPTQTFRLRTGSLAIDRGNSSVTTGALKLTTDQRGQPRLVGTAVDIGAFEAPQPPLDKSYTVAQGGTLTVTTANGLLTGMYNPLGRTVTVQLVPKSGPASGALTLNANGTFTYKPPAAFFGTVSFQFYEVVDGRSTGMFTATINVTKAPGRLI